MRGVSTEGTSFFLLVFFGKGEGGFFLVLYYGKEKNETS